MMPQVRSSVASSPHGAGRAGRRALPKSLRPARISRGPAAIAQAVFPVSLDRSAAGVISSVIPGSWPTTMPL